MKAIIEIYYKDGILDPAAKATKHALGAIGFKGVKDLRFCKKIELDLDTKNEKEALELAKEMATKLLVNEVIEDYSLEVVQ